MEFMSQNIIAMITMMVSNSEQKSVGHTSDGCIGHMAQPIIWYCLESAQYQAGIKLYTKYLKSFHRHTEVEPSKPGSYRGTDRSGESFAMTISVLINFRNLVFNR